MKLEAPQMYGPKNFHKTGHPRRPITSHVNALSTKLIAHINSNINKTRKKRNTRFFRTVQSPHPIQNASHNLQTNIFQCNKSMFTNISTEYFPHRMLIKDEQRRTLMPTYRINGFYETLSREKLFVLPNGILSDESTCYRCYRQPRNSNLKITPQLAADTVLVPLRWWFSCRMLRYKSKPNGIRKFPCRQGRKQHPNVDNTQILNSQLK